MVTIVATIFDFYTCILMGKCVCVKGRGEERGERREEVRERETIFTLTHSFHLIHDKTIFAEVAGTLVGVYVFGALKHELPPLTFG